MIDIVFSFDTTGSMSRVIDSVRANLVGTVDRLFSPSSSNDAPSGVEDIQIGIITHGDYCDMPNHLSVLPLCADSEQIKTFIRDSQDTSGGDHPECYELVLRTARKLTGWREGSTKVLVLIGDAPPHEYGDIAHVPSEIEADAIDRHVLAQIEVPHRSPAYKVALKWREQAEKCRKERGIIVFSCHAEPTTNQEAVSFYTTIAELTGGLYIPLYELSLFKDYMVGICLKAADGAEDIRLLQSEFEELREKLAREKDEKKKREIEEQQQEIQQAILSATRLASQEGDEIQSVFSAGVTKTAERVRMTRGIRSRTEAYETELQTQTPKVYSASRNSDFLHVLRSREGFETPAKSAKTVSVSREESRDTPSCARTLFSPTPRKRVYEVEATDATQSELSFDSVFHASHAPSRPPILDVIRTPTPVRRSRDFARDVEEIVAMDTRLDAAADRFYEEHKEKPKKNVTLPRYRLPLISTPSNPSEKEKK